MQTRSALPVPLPPAPLAFTLPEGWLSPAPRTSEGVVYDPDFGEDFPGCQLCEWCCHAPVQFYEPNHDRILCEFCTFTIAPFRPTKPYHRSNRYDQNMTGDSPRSLCHRIAYHVTELLFACLGGRLTDCYLDGQSSPEGVRASARDAVIETAELTFTAPLPWAEKLPDPDQDDRLLTFIKGQAFIGSDDDYLCALYHVCRCLDAKTDQQARWEVTTALKLTLRLIEEMERPSAPVEASAFQYQPTAETAAELFGVNEDRAGYSATREEEPR